MIAAVAAGRLDLGPSWSILGTTGVPDHTDALRKAAQVLGEILSWVAGGPSKLRLGGSFAKTMVRPERFELEPTSRRERSVRAGSTVYNMTW